MPALVELQRHFARAMTTGDGDAFAAVLRGGFDPGARLAIHLRHYATSLATAICEKFPATAWIVGAAAMREAARAYVRACPPLQPCIAEYGREFPRFLARHDCAADLPYLGELAELEWAVAQASIAVDAPSLSWAELASRGAERLLDSTLVLQPGARYVRCAWRVDELVQAYLGGTAPDRFVLLDVSTPIEVLGARGAFRLTRLDSAAFEFRAALAAGRTIGDAAEIALAIDPAFDPGNALRALVDARLVTQSIGTAESQSC
jgi:hypothetical protein